MRFRRSICAAITVAVMAVLLVASPPSPGVDVAAAQTPTISFTNVSDQLPDVVDEGDDGLWATWVDNDGDGFVDQRPSYGIAWGDVNDDGFLDVFVNNHAGDRFGPPPSLYVNQGDGTFENELDRFSADEQGAIANGDRHGAVWTDIDNDGDEDLLLLVGLNIELGRSLNKLFINEGGQLVDAAEDRGVQYGVSRAREPALLDINNDGLLDFINGSLADGQKDPELPPAIFQQNADGTFTDVLDDVGYEWNESYGLESAAIADLDGDGYPEIIQKQPLQVFSTGGDQLVDVTESIFTEIRPENDRGLIDTAVADFNGDAVLDLFFPSWVTDGHQLILSTPDGWEDASARSGLADVGFRTPDGAGVGVGDFDNDMDLDMLVLDRNTGGIDYLLENDGTGFFTAIPFPLTAVTQLLPRPEHRSISVVDYNNDGSLDLFETSSENDPTYRLLENEGNANSWLGIELEGTTSNRDGIGAMVYVTAGGVTQVRNQNGGLHFRVQDDKRLHFGLGANATVDEIRVVWPGGQEQTFTDVEAGQRLQIQEGGDLSASASAELVVRPDVLRNGCEQCARLVSPTLAFFFDSLTRNG